MKARDQPILTLLNTIHQIIMARLTAQYEEKEKWEVAVCPRVHKLVEKREQLTPNYSVRFCGNLVYEVSTMNHNFTVELDKKKCSCGLWELSGIPCVHGVCVYQKENQDPRRYVENVFLRETFLNVYRNFLVPIGGPTFWPKTNYNPILPPEVRVLPGRPKRNRNIDPQELKEQKEKAAAEKAERAKKARIDAQAGTYKASRKGGFITCTNCREKGHNKKTCPLLLNPQPQPGTTATEERGVPARETMSQPTPRRCQQGDGSSSRATPSTQPEPATTRSKRKTRG